MTIQTIVLGFGSIFFGIILLLVSYNILGRNFTHQDFKQWINNRRKFYKILGPLLILAGIAIFIFKA